jgi:hypothetical protein
VDSIVMVIEPCSIRRVIRLVGTRTTVSLRAVTPAVALGNITADATGTLMFENNGSDTVTLFSMSTAGATIVSMNPPAGSTLLPGGIVQVDYRIACKPTISEQIMVGSVLPCADTAATTFTGACQGAGPTAATVSLDSADVKVGDHVTLHLRLLDSQNLDAAGLFQWEAEVTYNPMVLVATGSTPDCYIEGTYAPCTSTISGTRTGASGVLANLDFTAVLGTDTQTEVALTSFHWVADTTSPVEVHNGLVRITDICEQGGIRLLSPKGQAFSIRVYPIPANTQLTIDVRGIGSQAGSYALYNYTGQQVSTGTLTPDAQGNALATVNVSSLGSGTYLLTIDARGTTNWLPVLITH